MTLTNLLVKLEYVSGCHVRRRQASSAALEDESRRDHENPLDDVAGLAIMLPVGEKSPEFDAFWGVSGGGPNDEP